MTAGRRSGQSGPGGRGAGAAGAVTRFGERCMGATASACCVRQTGCSDGDNIETNTLSAKRQHKDANVNVPGAAATTQRFVSLRQSAHHIIPAIHRHCQHET